MRSALDDLRSDLAVLPARSPLHRLQGGRLVRSVWFPARRIPSGRRAPLVSALMVTRGRPRLAETAIACFRAQTWPRRELVIIDSGRTDDLALARYIEHLEDPMIRHLRIGRSRLSLGALRNRSLAEARGEWICQWDDDDLSHPSRIAAQFAAARALRVDACLLLRETVWWPHEGRVAWSGPHLWEHSLLAKRACVHAYPPLRRGEDTPVVEALVRDRPVALLDEPRLYVYVGHHDNTYGDDHFAALWATATRRAKGRQAGAWLAALSRTVPVGATRTALRRSKLGDA
jgi:glycosyltransferase involved in cell wall biosynthesis